MPPVASGGGAGCPTVSLSGVQHQNRSSGTARRRRCARRNGARRNGGATTIRRRRRFVGASLRHSHSKRALCVGRALVDGRRRGRCRCRAPAAGGASRRRSGESRREVPTRARTHHLSRAREARPRDAQSARCTLSAHVSVSAARRRCLLPPDACAQMRVVTDGGGGHLGGTFVAGADADAPCALQRAQSRARAASHAVLARRYRRAPLASACGHDAARNKRGGQYY